MKIKPFFFPTKGAQVFLCGALVMISLSGCETTDSTREGTTVKEFNQDKEKFITAIFDVSKLSPEVLKPVQKAVPMKSMFKKLTVQFDVTETKSPSGTVAPYVSNLQSVRTYYGRDNGLVLFQDELKRNDVSYRVNNVISLFGMLELDDQPVFLNNSGIGASYRDVCVNRINSIEPTPAVIQENTSFNLAYEMAYRRKYYRGKSRPISAETSRFSFGAHYPAAKVNSVLSGNAMDAMCTTTNTAGTVTLRQNYVYLVNYGVALPKTSSTANTKIEFVIKGVQVE